jgi:hypothetical protein
VKAHGSNVGLRAFEKLKPYYVQKLKERNTCACKYHVEMVELQDGVNNMRGEGKRIHDRHCSYNYDVCGSNIIGVCVIGYTTIFQGLMDM